MLLKSKMSLLKQMAKFRVAHQLSYFIYMYIDEKLLNDSFVTIHDFICQV